jgi:hypothetical protein
LRSPTRSPIAPRSGRNASRLANIVRPRNITMQFSPSRWGMRRLACSARRAPFLGTAGFGKRWRCSISCACAGRISNRQMGHLLYARAAGMRPPGRGCR